MSRIGVIGERWARQERRPSLGRWRLASSGTQAALAQFSRRQQRLGFDWGGSHDVGPVGSGMRDRRACFSSASAMPQESARLAIMR